MRNQKICIIGDGLSGLTAALSLKNLNLEIDLFFKEAKKPFITDTRTTAISQSSFKFLKDEINIEKSNLFWPCKKINLFYEKDNKNFNFLNYDENKNNLMYIYQNQKLKKYLFHKLKKSKNVKLIKKEIKKIDHKDGTIELSKKKRKSYDLVILCLGRESIHYKKILNEKSIKKDYKEVAITCHVKHNSKINGASQYFYEEGPLAILPFKNSFFSLVWSVDNKFFKNNETNIKLIIERKIKTILTKNSKIKISKIKSFPIFLRLSKKYHNKNCLILGEGLHTIHPIAGQGFNLILRDIKKLKELLKKNIDLGLNIKNSFILKNFYNSRNAENTIFGLGVDLTNHFFKKNKHFNGTKFALLENIVKYKNFKKITKYISDKGFF